MKIMTKKEFYEKMKQAILNMDSIELARLSIMAKKENKKFSTEDLKKIGYKPSHMTNSLPKKIQNPLNIIIIVSLIDALEDIKLINIVQECFDNDKLAELFSETLIEYAKQKLPIA